MLLRRLGLALAAGAVALAVGLIGVAFLIAAAYLWLTSIFSSDAAAAIIGAALVVVALLVLLLGFARRRREPLPPEQLVFAALRLVARSVESAPEKALIAALIAGVLSEWFGERKEKSGRD
jgi:apolipoprotein N-acyltransferase